MFTELNKITKVRPPTPQTPTASLSATADLAGFCIIQTVYCLPAG